MFSLKLLIIINLIIIHQLINECSCEPMEKITKCLTPPNTLERIEKVIKECQEDVRINIFKEAFNLINGNLKNVHHHNNDHDEHDDDEIGTIYVENSHHHIIAATDHDNINEQQQYNSDSHHIQYHQQQPQHHQEDEYNFDPNNHHNKHEHFITTLLNYHKNDNKNEPENHSHNSRYTTVKYPTPNHNAYSNLFTNYNMDHTRKSNTIIQNKYDNDDDYTHPTTVSYHDKRIAGCLMHCIYAKNHAIDKLGWPTLDGLVNLYSEGVHEHGYFMATLRATDSCLKGASLKHNVNRHLLPEKGESCDLAFDIFDCISDRITEYCSEHHYYHHNQQQQHHHHHHH